MFNKYQIKQLLFGQDGSQKTTLMAISRLSASQAESGFKKSYSML